MPKIELGDRTDLLDDISLGENFVATGHANPQSTDFANHSNKLNMIQLAYLRFD